jgi:phage FluMu protein gp41
MFNVARHPSPGRLEARAAGPHCVVRRWNPSVGASAHHGGGGFQTRPHRAVTGMIGATTGGERVHISPGSAGILPSQTRRGRDALTRRCLRARAAGPHCVVCRWNPSVGASAHHSGGGFQTRPHRAVTGMIGATTGGERVHISPESAGILPSQTRRGRDALTRRRLRARAAGPHCVVCRWNPSVGASAHHSGGGFQTRPHRAVTGMIGATTGGERVHISPESAGILPSQTQRGRDALTRRRLRARAAGPHMNAQIPLVCSVRLRRCRVRAAERA